MVKTPEDSEERTYYCLIMDNYNFGYMSISNLLDTIDKHISGGYPGDDIDIQVTSKKMTQQEYAELPEVDL